MKSVEDTLLGRRSIRRYERQPVEREKLDLIYAAIRNTPTSYNGQQFSVIAVTDQTVKEELYEITGQKQIKTSAILLVFCLDYHKLRVAAAAKGMRTPPFESTIDGYTVGVIDASMAMMSAVTAAESLGLGCCCVGYVRTADPRRISDMLGLPEGVSIVCGLTIGYPRGDARPEAEAARGSRRAPRAATCPMRSWLRCWRRTTGKSPSSTAAGPATGPTTTGPAT